MTIEQIPLDDPLANRLALAVEQFGEVGLVERAIGLLEGRNEGEDVLLYAGGRHARGILDGAPAVYWPEVWGARVLLHVWDASATSAVVGGLENRAWRVREMCLKVCAQREISDSRTLKRRLTDSNPRVRAAAARAIAVVGDSVDEQLLSPLLRDPEIDVRRATGEALKSLAAKFS